MSRDPISPAGRARGPGHVPHGRCRRRRQQRGSDRPPRAGRSQGRALLPARVPDLDRVEGPGSGGGHGRRRRSLSCSSSSSDRPSRSASVRWATLPSRLCSSGRSRPALSVARPTVSSQAKRASQLLRVLTAQPKVTRRPEALSRSRARDPGGDSDRCPECRDRRSIRHLSRTPSSLTSAGYSRSCRRPTARKRPSATSRCTDRHRRRTATRRRPSSCPRRTGYGAATAVTATVVALRPKGEAVLRLQDGRDLEVPVDRPDP